MARVNILDPTFTDPQLEEVRSGDIFLSNIPGAKGFEDILDRQGNVLQRGFKSFQETFRSVLPSRPSDADLAGIQTFTERDRTRLRESAFTGFGGDPYRDIETEFLENFASRRNDLINTIGRGHFTWRSLPNQPKEIQEFVAKTVAQAEAKGLEQAKQIQKAQQKDLERQLTEFDRRQGKVDAQRKKTEKAAGAFRGRKETAQKEIFKLENDLLDRVLMDDVSDGIATAIKRQNAINQRIKILKERFETPTETVGTREPGGQPTTRQRPVEETLERIQARRGADPSQEAKFRSAIQQATDELNNAGILDGLTALAAKALIRKRAKRIFDDLIR